jgi:transcriptional regulator with XRE-family HTH domain
MAKQLSELMKKINPTVLEAAKAKADQEIFELRLAQLRQTVEMSQHDLAVALGISQPSVANLEKRGNEVKISSLKRYIEALGCKLSLDVEMADGRHIGINV